jgi:hypothetical protein
LSGRDGVVVAVMVVEGVAGVVVGGTVVVMAGGFVVVAEADVVAGETVTGTVTTVVLAVGAAGVLVVVLVPTNGSGAASGAFVVAEPHDAMKNPATARDDCQGRLGFDRRFEKFTWCPVVWFAMSPLQGLRHTDLSLECRMAE